MGDTGTDKRPLTTTLGIKAMTRHDKQGKRAYRLMPVDRVILDERDDLPFSQAGGALSFHLRSKLDERAGVIITTHPTSAEWPAVFGDAKLTTAWLDRLPHHGPIVETGNASFRSRQSSQTAKARVKSRKLSQRGKPAGAETAAERRRQ